MEARRRSTAKPKTHIRKDDPNPESSVGGLRRTLCGPLHPARAIGQRQSVVPEMPPVPQEGPLTRVAPFPTSQTAERLRALLRAVFQVAERAAPPIQPPPPR